MSTGDVSSPLPNPPPADEASVARGRGKKARTQSVLFFFLV